MNSVFSGGGFGRVGGDFHRFILLQIAGELRYQFRGPQLQELSMFLCIPVYFCVHLHRITTCNGRKLDFSKAARTLNEFHGDAVINLRKLESVIYKSVAPLHNILKVLRELFVLIKRS